MKDKMESKFKIISLVLVFSLFISSVTTLPAQAQEILPDNQSDFSAFNSDNFKYNSEYLEELSKVVETEETIITEIDTEQELSDDCVIVTIKQALSKINKLYEEDFSDISCEAIEDLTALPEDIGDLEYLNFEEFRQILRLTLSEKSKETVINSIKALEQREDVLCAEPNYITGFAPCVVPNDTYYNSQWGLHKI